MHYFVDIEIVTTNIDYSTFKCSENKELIQFLKCKLMKKSGIPFSGKFEYISSFGNLKLKDKTKISLPGLSNPYDIKIDNKLQLIFVADYGNGRIVVFDLEGYYLYSFTTKNKPETIFVDQVYDRILISGENSVYCCNKRGNNMSKIYSPKEGILFALTMDVETEYIYISDTVLQKIIVIDLNGNFKFEFKGNGFNEPYGLIFNSKRELLVSDTYNNRIQVLDCNGQFIKYINGPFDKNWGITVDKTNDNILVADFCNEKVQYLDKDGKLIKTVEKANYFRYPIGIDYCSVNGYVYVCNETSSDVLIFK